MRNEMFSATYDQTDGELEAALQLGEVFHDAQPVSLPLLGVKLPHSLSIAEMLAARVSE